MLLKFNRREFFTTGFFVGILWFYWMSFSLIYYGFAFLIPIEILAIGVIYGLMFMTAGLVEQIWLKAILLILVSNFHPFGFNWLNFEAVFVPGIFRADIYGLTLIFTAIVSLFYIQNRVKFIVFCILLIFAVQFENKSAKLLPFEIKLANTQVAQELKWEKGLKNKFINENLSIIDSAINSGFRAVVLPESAFPVFMTHEKNLAQELREKSEQIAVIAGALTYENKRSFNSTYLFDNGNMSRFDKFILVPFGEEIPLPNFIKDMINRLFFNGASDFKTANSVSDYEIDGIKIRNAICYEATRDELFSGEFDVMIAISNNAWFKPSTEPTLQRLLLKYYATKYNKAIYHSANGSRSEIILPKKSVFSK